MRPYKVSSRDVQEIVSKLSSDKAKTREEGIKLLSTWLQGERASGFCRYIAQETLVLKPDEIPHSETWPFLISLLTQCVSLEISSSKRRLPKTIFAKTLRTVVQRAEDDTFSGKRLMLLSVVKLLYNHICDVLKDAPSFQSEYGSILRHLLAVKDYRFHMRKRVYCSLVNLYLEKVQTSLNEISGTQSISTLHSLFANPPGDFPDVLREDIVRGFVAIFSSMRDEGKVLRSLIECVNTYLLKDGPNLGCQSWEIHDAVKQFVFRYWISTCDHVLKDALVLYVRLQLSLVRGADDGGALVEQVVDVIGKELDQTTFSSSITRNDKSVNLTSSQCHLLELAAFVFYQACTSTTKVPSAKKRAKRENTVVYLNEGLTKGKWMWNAVFCYLTQMYCSRINKDILIYWFEGICASFERMINDANTDHSYDCLLWTLRSLQNLSSVLLSVSRVEIVQGSPFTPGQLDRGWHTIWSCLLRGLPVFSNVISVTDAALLLLGDIMLSDSVNAFNVPQDVWDLRLFKRSPSLSILCFITSYFSRRGSQGDLRDSIYLRENLLRAVFSMLNLQECLKLNEHIVLLLPAAAYALCAGCAPFQLESRNVSSYFSSINFSESVEERVKGGDHKNGYSSEYFECSVEVLANVHHCSVLKVSQAECYQTVRLPHQLKDSLLKEMETCIIDFLADKVFEKMLLSEVFYICALLSNLLFGAYVTRLRDNHTALTSKVGQDLLTLLNIAVSGIKKRCNDARSGFLSFNAVFDGITSTVTSLKCFVSSPLFSKWRDENVFDIVLYREISQSFERLLKAVVELYDECSHASAEVESETDLPDSSAPCTFGSKCQSDSSTNIIMDMDLDIDLDLAEVPIDADITSVRCKTPSGISTSVSASKCDAILLISSFFAVVPVATWDILFKFMEKENDAIVLENILCYLCRQPFWSTSKKFSDLVLLINKMVDLRISLKLPCASILLIINDLLRNLISLNISGKDIDTGIHKNVAQREKTSEQSLTLLGDILCRVAEHDLSDWSGRSILIDCLCNFIALRPHIAQTVTEKLLIMLQDADFRVRFSLARHIGILFQTWDGHSELFQDICSNFGGNLVIFSKEKVVTAKEVLHAGPQPRPLMETIIITLVHLAFYSEKIELEAVFMMCVICAIDPCQRDLVGASLDNLARLLQYASRSKYLEELMGSILFCWVACGVSLVSLVEIRDLFVSNMEPRHFTQYCCHWLLPALILHGETSNLNWVAKMACQQASVLVKDHFVSIFSVCMALHCSKNSVWEDRTAVIQNSILSLAEISENERDKLIKKHMVAIVSHILSLASFALDPVLPSFSRTTIVHAIQTVVDGFLDMDEGSKVGVVDKINIFRADRVFMFIVEMHYKVTSAVHHRHKCHHLTGIEVLINVLGHRAALPSTFNYLLNLVGQYIGCQALQEQCCSLLSTLLQTFRSSPSKETAEVLGGQLQFLVSELVVCCVLVKTNMDISGHQPSAVLSLLNQLTLDSDPLLYDYIKELEAFPERDIFDDIRIFHGKLCQDYSATEQLFKLVKRSQYLPPRLLKCSLKSLHKKIVMEEVIQSEGMTKDSFDYSLWQCDNQIAQAVWKLLPMCGMEDKNSFTALLSDFISKVGIGDPHSVVFHLPRRHVSVTPNHESASESHFLMDCGVSQELLVSLMRLLKKYLMDNSVNIIDLTSQTIQGILSTEKGQRALLSFDSYERSLIEVHCKGVNMELVQNLLCKQERKFQAEAVSLENSALWDTQGKDFRTWICPLVYALIGFCDDKNLRLCQDIVLLKAEVAELLFSNVVVNLAGMKHEDIDLCKIISLQVQKNILTRSNKLTKSIQVTLDALNELRLCHMLDKNTSLEVSSKREASTCNRPSSYSSRSRSSGVKAREFPSTSPVLMKSTSLWDKVYS